MHKRILAAIAAGAVTLAITAASQADARPIGGGWGAGRTGGGSAATARFIGSHRGHKHRLNRPGFVAATGIPSDRYLAESGGFLADSAGYLASNDADPDDWSHGYPGASYLVSFGYPRVVTVYHGAPHRVSSHIRRHMHGGRHAVAHVGRHVRRVAPR
jgi:hypothetical protein